MKKRKQVKRIKKLQKEIAKKRGTIIGLIIPLYAVIFSVATTAQRWFTISFFEYPSITAITTLLIFSAFSLLLFSTGYLLVSETVNHSIKLNKNKGSYNFNTTVLKYRNSRLKRATDHIIGALVMILLTVIFMLRIASLILY